MHQIKAEWLLFHIMYVTKLFCFGTHCPPGGTTICISRVSRPMESGHMELIAAQNKCIVGGVDRLCVI